MKAPAKVFTREGLVGDFELFQAQLYTARGSFSGFTLAPERPTEPLKLKWVGTPTLATARTFGVSADFHMRFLSETLTVRFLGTDSRQTFDLSLAPIDTLPSELARRLAATSNKYTSIRVEVTRDNNLALEAAMSELVQRQAFDPLDQALIAGIFGGMLSDWSKVIVSTYPTSAISGEQAQELIQALVAGVNRSLDELWRCRLLEIEIAAIEEAFDAFC